MGEASRRKAEISALKARTETWKDSLVDEERLIAQVAETAYNKIVIGRGVTGGCYHLAFFLRKFLWQQHGIVVNIAVGYINDGQWDGATSHAWLEYEGKKVDISLHKTADALDNPVGDLIILDFVLKKGAVSYAYWKEMPAKALLALSEMSRSSADLADTIAFKDREHQKIVELSQNDEGIETYFRGAPDSGTYEFLSGLMN